MNTGFQAARGEAMFLLKDQFPIAEVLPTNGPTMADIESAFMQVADFSEKELGPTFSDTDREGCRMGPNGRVLTPTSFPSLMEKYVALWDGSSLACIADVEPVQYLIFEMLMGANPAFMTYVGFTQPAITLLTKFGTADQRERFVPLLNAYRATACLCITERQAGSDLSQMTMAAHRQDNGAYLLTGHKWLISAGMHDLTDNIFYFVLARTGASSKGMMGLSCFITPRYRLGANGEPIAGNGVHCEMLPEKMGFRGCANPLLTFGKTAPCEAYLLGDREGRGLTQLMAMMVPARISTGIYGLGMAQAAHSAAERYAKKRIQGKKFEQSMSLRAPSLPIEQHPDVKRMLTETYAITTACRTLIAYLGYCQLLARSDVVPKETRGRMSHMFDILTPIAKAYLSDQVWRVAETAIQIHGGVGYLKENTVEQIARDCKILSIWEGTNHLQSQFLFRDKLGLCLNDKRIDLLLGEMDAVANRCAAHGDFRQEAASLKQSIGQLRTCLQRMGNLARAGNISLFPKVSTELMGALADIVATWLLLDGALIAHSKLQNLPEVDEELLLERQIESARYYVFRRLPHANATLGIVSADIDFQDDLVARGDRVSPVPEAAVAGRQI